MFRPGQIRQITLKNFLTHTYVDVFPDPNLNMILGANGSGKSSIVAGIILGLGGTPKTIGRGRSVSEYVKHNCNEASIDLILQGDKEDDRILIKRKINIRDQTTWFINSEKTTLAALRELTGRYSIQVDNLCQFLPQDRVADFAKLNKQELLKESQIALCRTDLLEKQEALITDRDRHKFLITAIETNDKKLQAYKMSNQRLEGKVKNFAKKKEYLKVLEGINRKNSWLVYLAKAEERQQLKEERDAAQRDLHAKQQEAKPIEQAITIEKSKLNKCVTRNETLTNQLNCITNNINLKQKRVDTIHSNIKRIKDETAASIAAIADKSMEIESVEMRLTAQTNDKNHLQDTVHEEAAECEKLKRESYAIDQKAETFRQQIVSLQQKKTSKLHEIRAVENQIDAEQRVMENRMAFLKQLDRDAHAGTLWLRDHQNLFRGKVYQPLLLEINVNNPKHALYVEDSIPFRDKVAFLCTDKDDVQTLNEHLCVRQGLRINILHQDPGMTRPRSRFSIEQLRRYGFHAFVDSLFTAPEPIVTYLCRDDNLHNIPVAFNNTPYNSDECPVLNYYRDDQKFRITVSSYTGNKARTLSIIKGDKSLSYCVNHGVIETCQTQIAHLRENCEHYDTEIAALETQIEALHAHKPAIEAKMQRLRNNRQQLVNLEGKIANLARRLKQLKADNEHTNESIEEQAREKSTQLVNRLAPVLKEINADLKAYSAKQLEVELDKRTVAICRTRIVALEASADDFRQLVRKAEASVQHHREDLNEMTREARFLLARAKDISGGFTPEDDGFDNFRVEYDGLPNEIDELDKTRDSVNARLQCLNDLADDGELEEYEECIGKITELEEMLTRYNYEHNRIIENMDQREREWLEPLGELVEQIHVEFSRAFEKMGCAGEVKIYKGDDERDYEKYGIRVSVTYRNDSPLQELNNVTQSGGERAVATAAYMLSMQELTPVPFRCVDEINQGMDANNERRIFDLLFDVTSREDTSQYFFISPKLVHNLKYASDVKVHFVHNGPFVIDQAEWNACTSLHNQE